MGGAPHDEFDIFFPQLQVEWPSAAGVLAEVGAIMLHHFVWHHATVYHPQQAEKRTERLGEVDDKGSVIGGFETVYIAEYPAAGRVGCGTEYAVEAVEEVGSSDRTCGVVCVEQRVFVKQNIAPQGEGVGLAVGADGPAVGDARLWLQLFVEAHKAVIQLCAAPDEGLVFGIGRVEGGNARRLVVAEYLFVAVVGHPAGRQS